MVTRKLPGSYPATVAFSATVRIEYQTIKRKDAPTLYTVEKFKRCRGAVNKLSIDKLDGGAQGVRNSADYSNYLISESPVVFQPTLAAIFGVDEAILLQQIHWFSKHPHDRRVELRLRDGRVWVKMKPESMLNKIDGHLKFFSLRTFRRKVSNLKATGVLLIMHMDVLDTSNWYAIDMERLHECAVEWQLKHFGGDSEALCQNGTHPDATNKNGTTTDAKVARTPVPEVSQPSAKVAPHIKDKELESTEDVERYDLIFDSLTAEGQGDIDREAAKRLAMLGPFGERPGALRNMRRHLLREGWKP